MRQFDSYCTECLKVTDQLDNTTHSICMVCGAQNSLLNYDGTAHPYNKWETAINVTMSNNNQPAISKYIYVGNNKIVGPLTMSAPNDSNSNYRTLCEFEPEAAERYEEEWEQHLASLPRIDVIGKHSFTEGQILGEGEDIKIEERWVRTEDDYYSNGHHKGSKTYKAIAVPIVHQPAISKEEVLSEYVWIEMAFPENKPDKIGVYLIGGSNVDWQMCAHFNGIDWLIEGNSIITNEVAYWLKRVQTAALREENTKLKAENAELREALSLLVHLHLCEQEGLSSGQPTPKMWLEAVDKASNILSKHKP